MSMTSLTFAPVFYLVSLQVCFAVRTAYMHDSSEEVQSQTMFEDVDIDGFILCKYMRCTLHSCGCDPLCTRSSTSPRTPLGLTWTAV
jgi:hypothetical protein